MAQGPTETPAPREGSGAGSPPCSTEPDASQPVPDPSHTEAHGDSHQAPEESGPPAGNQPLPVAVQRAAERAGRSTAATRCEAQKQYFKGAGFKQRLSELSPADYLRRWGGGALCTGKQSRGCDRGEQRRGAGGAPCQGWHTATPTHQPSRWLPLFLTQSSKS